MKFKTATSLIAIALIAPTTAASAAPGGFQLQPSPTPTSTPQVQGPVDTEGLVPVRPRAITQPTPTPAPSDVTPTSAPTAAPTSAPTNAATTRPSVSRPTPRPAANQPTQPGPQATPTAAPTSVQTALPAGEPSLADDLLQGDAPIALPTSAAPIEAQTGTPTASAVPSYTLWIAGLLGLAILIGGALLFWRRQQPKAAAAPVIEPPSKWVSSSSDAADLPPLEKKSDSGNVTTTLGKAEPPLVAAVTEQSASKSALQIKAQAISLGRSLMNATISYRLELMNLNNRPITEISVKADLVTAHGKAPIGDQVATETTELPESAFVASIDERETHEVSGTFSLPVRAIKPITQRGATLYVPLLRLRVEAPDLDPIICTFVVGIKPPERGAKLQPFRLDEMAQTYRNIGLRLLD